MTHRSTARRWFGAAALAIIAALSASDTLAGGTLRIAREQDSTSLDPALTILNSDIWVMQNMNCLLVKVNDAGNDIVPDCAESWSISPDGLTYTFTLREGLKFSDGSPLKASDVKFSLERVRDKPDSIWGGMFSLIKGIETPDDRTVAIALSEPSTPFLAQLAIYAAAILPEAAVNEKGDTFGTSPVGAGAFRFVSWEPGNVIKLEKNEHYYDPSKPQLDAVEWYYIPNDNTRILKLQAGELDAILFVPFNRIADLQQDANLRVHLDPSSRMDHLLVNHLHAPLDNKNVRKALNMAMDQQAIVDVATSGFGTPANSFIPAGAMFYNADNPHYAYDPEGAKAMLAAEGVTDLSLKLLIASGDAVHEQIAVLIKDQLAKVGVDVQIEKQEPGQAWESTVAGDYDISINYWTNDIIDPDQKASFCVAWDEANQSYYTNYKNQAVSDLVLAGRVELDAEKRRAIYHQIQQIAKDDVHWIDLYYSPFRNASRANVSGLLQNPMGKFTLEDVSIE